VRSSYVRCCGLEIHLLEWGAAGSPPLIAWHGVARNAQDFYALGVALSDRFHVIAPDTIGRGLSQWSAHPEREYAGPFYLQLAQALFDELHIERAGWIGTSMGGLIGLGAAATVLHGRIAALFFNDITPAAPDPEGLRRIGAYLAAPQAFEGVSEYETYLRAVYAPAGPRSDAAWRAMAEASLRRLPDGRITTHYDPAIAAGFAAVDATADLWWAYDALTIPAMLLRGERSDIASATNAAAMAARGPKAHVVEIPEVGHAPWLDAPEITGLVRDFFARTVL